MNTQANWISVESRLPDHGQTVLIAFGPNRTIGLATYYSMASKWLDAVRGTEEYSPHFWMPLPEAPPKPDPFEEWWKRSMPTAGLSCLETKDWCRQAWDAALKSKEHA